QGAGPRSARRPRAGARLRPLRRALGVQERQASADEAGRHAVVALKSLPTDERRTPRWFFELVSEVFGPFDLDSCAARWNAQCRRFVTKEQDIFRHHPPSRRTWRNPPYSRGNL